jgi:fumarate reductase subunit D
MQFFVVVSFVLGNFDGKKWESRRIMKRIHDLKKNLVLLIVIFLLLWKEAFIFIFSCNDEKQE